MEVDREIIRKAGDVMEGIVLQVTKEFTIAVLVGSITAYTVYFAWKKIHVNRKVKEIRASHTKRLEKDQQLIKDAINEWEQSDEYRKQLDQLGIAEGGLEDYILGLTSEDLLDALSSGKVTALTALRSYQKKAIEVSGHTNCVTTWLVDADERARKLDNLSSEKLGPLHGLPVSIKECFFVKDTYSTAGLSTFMKNKNTVNCPAVETILKLGGVPFCKTNIPQVMYSLECGNPIFGVTSNPHNKAREAGGSSGGEGALIGGGGSPLGLGSDIGGSLRNPAAFCGLYSMRPTTGRHLSAMDVVPSAGFNPVGILPVGGLMAPTARVLTRAWREIWNMNWMENPGRLDLSIAPVPFNSDLFQKKVRIGYFVHDEMLQPVPGVTRAISEAIALLESKGYQCVYIPSPPTLKMFELYNGIVLADQLHGVKKNLQMDQSHRCLRGLFTIMSIYNLPRIFRKMIIEPIGRLFTRIPLVDLFSSTKDLMEAVEIRNQEARKYIEQMEKEDVDVILCPAQLTPAPKSNQIGDFPVHVLPYIPWNVLNFPSGIVPITRYGPKDTEGLEVYASNDFAYNILRSHCKDADGLPLAVQIAGKPYQEEQILQVMEVLQDVETFSRRSQ